jgi:hypothetical protein
MNPTLPATAAESRHAGARFAGLLPRAFAVFVALHGLVHLVGFTVPWRLGGPRSLEYSTQILNHSVEVGDTAVKLIGLVWLAAAIAFVAVAVLLWRGHPLARRAAMALLLVSLVLCVAAFPGAIVGLAIDVVSLGLLAVAPDRVIARRPDRIAGERPRPPRPAPPAG